MPLRRFVAYLSKIPAIFSNAALVRLPVDDLFFCAVLSYHINCCPESLLSAIINVFLPKKCSLQSHVAGGSSFRSEGSYRFSHSTYKVASARGRHHSLEGLDKGFQRGTVHALDSC
jgi:hypothetical protein